MGYLPVRNAALFGVQIESGVTSCLNRAPSSARRSMFGVLIVSLPKQPRSAIPRSSTRKIRTFGFADVTQIMKNKEIKVVQGSHIFVLLHRATSISNPLKSKMATAKKKWVSV